MEDKLPSFVELNLKRCVEGFEQGLDDPKFNDLYYIACIMQELGEVAAIKTKLIRGFNKREEKKFRAKILRIAKENGNLESETKILNETSHELLESMWRTSKLMDLADELADVNIYLNLLATRNHIDLKYYTLHKFNEVSKEMGLGPEFFLKSINQF